jgi:hypothetical protein
MKTECTPTQLESHALGQREVVGKFDGGGITSDAGGLICEKPKSELGSSQNSRDALKICGTRRQSSTQWRNW